MKKEKVSVEITKQDKLYLDNLVRLIGRMKIKLDGAEVILASDSLKWIVKLQKQIEELDNKPDDVLQVVNKEPIKEQPKAKKHGSN